MVGKCQLAGGLGCSVCVCVCDLKKCVSHIRLDDSVSFLPLLSSCCIKDVKMRAELLELFHF